MTALGSMVEWVLLAALCYVLALSVFAAIEAVRERKKRPPFHIIRHWMACLLKNGYDGESVIFRDTAESRFIRLEKYTDAAGSPGIKLTFPATGWGQRHLTDLRELAAQNELVLEGSGGAGPAYAHIAFGSDLDGAFALCRKIWTEFFGFDAQTRFFGKTPDLSTIDESLGSAAQPSEGERRRRYFLHMSARLKHAGLGWMQATGPASAYTAIGSLALLGGTGFVIAVVGLPIAALSALDDPPDWRIEFADIALQGSTAGLALFCLYLLAAPLFYRLLRISTINVQIVSRFEWAFHAPKRLVFVLIPVAVVLTWLQI